MSWPRGTDLRKSLARKPQAARPRTRRRAAGSDGQNGMSAGVVLGGLRPRRHGCPLCNFTLSSREFVPQSPRGRRIGGSRHHSSILRVRRLEIAYRSRYDDGSPLLVQESSMLGIIGVATKRKKRSPLKAPPLRTPGQSLERRLDDVLQDKVLHWLLYAVLFPGLPALEWARWYFAWPSLPHAPNRTAAANRRAGGWKVLQSPEPSLRMRD
jgi:hypothetical protein